MNAIIELRKILKRWGKKNIRSYPWRYIEDPYKVLVSEFMLHRTQTKQVLPIYDEFISQFPSLNVYALSERSQKEDILLSLGLNWRIKNMLNALDELWILYSEIPVEYNTLMKIQGIGQYIAGATICFTQNQPIVIVDSNIVRVIGRIFGLDISGEARRKKEIINKIKETVDPKNPRDFYYAIIDLSHMLCQPRTPKCLDCPLSNLPCSYAKKENRDKEISQ